LFAENELSIHVVTQTKRSYAGDNDLPLTMSAAAARKRQFLSSTARKKRRYGFLAVFILLFAAALNREVRLDEFYDLSSFSAVANSKATGAVVFLAPQRNEWGWGFGMDRFCMLMRAVRSVDLHLNTHHGPYPIYILVAKDHALDPKRKDAAYTKNDRSLIRSWAPHSTIHFVEINMYSGEALEPGTTREQILDWRKNGTDGAVRGRDLGYQSMCRLWSGRLQNMKFLDQHKYYLRMDDDSLLLEALQDDPFQTMQEKNLSYAFRRPAHEKWGIDQLWKVSKPHLNLSKKRLPFLSGKPGKQTYTGSQPYNNFHVATVEFWRSPRWMRLWEEMNDNHLFFKFRVGDANVHAIAIMAMMMEDKKYERWEKFPYAHNSNDMRGWGKDRGWAAECEAAYDAGKLIAQG